LQHRLEIEGRSADDLEHIGGGGLLLQRFAQLVEQAGVLDRDDGLGSEVLDQLDLLVGEWADFLPVDAHGADQFVLLEHRNGNKTACTGGFDQLDHARVTINISWLLPQIGDMDHIKRFSDAGERHTPG
jgi:hypothetical protein